MELSDDELLQKHKKERKDLQAAIQSLKKKAGKKDKKETAAAIAKMETDLKNRQQAELESLGETKPSEPVQLSNGQADLDSLADNLKTLNHELTDSQEHQQVEPDCLPENDDSSAERVPKALRLSKAQRRRNNKESKELENQRRIAEQEIENKHGPRNLESLAIKKILKSRELFLQEIPSDGDCLYRAIRHQLQIHSLPLLSVAELRTQTSQYMKAHKNDMLPFLITDDGDVMTDDGFEQYCNQVATTKAWGGQVELTALAEILKNKIEVIQAAGPSTILGEGLETTPLVITYHRHMYGLGAHYNSTNIGDVETSMYYS